MSLPPPPPPTASSADLSAQLRAQGAVQGRPSVAVMWINAALFWGFFPGIYLVYLTFRNIAWARRNGQPWLRYALPLGTLVFLFIALLVVGALLPDPSTDPYDFPQ